MKTLNSLEDSICQFKRKKLRPTVLLSLITLLLVPYLSQFSQGGQANITDNSLAQSTQNLTNHSWSMFHHDPYHTGYSISKAPNSNLTIWKYAASSKVYSSPAVAYGRVFIGTDEGKVLALWGITGALKWNFTTGGFVRSSPALADGIVFVGSNDYKVYALNATTGTQIWSYTTGGAILSSPTVTNGKVFVGSVDGNIYALNSTNGSLLWSYSIGDVRSSPAVANGKVFIASFVSRKIYAMNETTGALIWSYYTGSWIMSSPAIANERLFIGANNGKVYALNATNGNLLWSYTTGGDVQSTPAVANGRVYVGSFDDKIYALNETTGTLVWSYTTSGDVFSSPAVADGKVFVGSYDNNLYSLNETTGALIWKYTFDGVVRSSPAVADGRVFVGSLDGNITAFGTHDIAIKSVTLSSNRVHVGETVDVTVVVKNEGSELETFNVTVYYNDTLLETKPVLNLVPDAEKTLIFSWNTTTTQPSKYVIKAVATILPDEIDTADNIYIDGVLNIVKKPFASFIYSPSTPLVGELVLFNASASTPDGGYITEYLWNFGDGNITSTENSIITHIYTTPETYNVTLTVIDSDELNNTAWSLITVIGKPHAAFTYSPTHPLEGQTVTFNASNSTPNGGEIIRYKWNFDDGNTTESTNPLITHEYSAFGSYNATLTVFDSEGLNDTTWQLVTVIAPPKAAFDTPSPTIVEQPVTFNASASVPNGGTIIEYRWNFGDGETAITDEPIIVHIYFESKIYNVTLTVKDSEGLNDTAWTTLLVAVQDIAITNVKPDRNIVGQGTILRIYITVANQGNLTETFNVTAYYNNTAIETRTVTLAGGSSTTIPFNWDTTDVIKSNYILSAEASTLWGEKDTTDNALTDGFITLSLIGDVTGPEGTPDGEVDIRDLATIAKAYGSVAGDPWYNPNYDIDGDGKIDIRDIAAAALNFGQVDP